MTIKWGDPIECNGVRPDWLRDDEPISVTYNGGAGGWANANGSQVYPGQTHIRLPADHPAYVALARGFHPWSGGDSAPDDWDGGGVLYSDEKVAPPFGTGVDWVRDDPIDEAEIIGYRQRCRDYVRIVPFTRAEWDAVPDYTAWAQSVGLIRPETNAERFTRETGRAVTEAVEAALNWKGE